MALTTSQLKRMQKEMYVSIIKNNFIQYLQILTWIVTFVESECKGIGMDLKDHLVPTYPAAARDTSLLDKLHFPSYFF